MGTETDERSSSHAKVVAVVICAALVLICGAAIYSSLTTESVYYDPLGPAGMPIGVSIVIAGLALFYITRNAGAFASLRESIAAIDRHDAAQITICTALMILYIFVVSYRALPFVVPTATLLLALGFTLATERRGAVLSVLLMAAITTAVSYAVFVRVFLFDLG